MMAHRRFGRIIRVDTKSVRAAGRPGGVQMFNLEDGRVASGTVPLEERSWAQNFLGSRNLSVGTFVGT
jgi:hypothetical protein